MDGCPWPGWRARRLKWAVGGVFAAALAAQPVLAATVPPAGRPAANASAATETPPTIAAQAFELLDAKSGRVLAAYKADTRFQPASLAKMMTFDLAMQAIAAGRVTPDTPIPVGVDAWHIALNPDDSRMFLSPNVPVPLKDLLVGMMVPSGNDAALAIADYLGGSETGFVTQMNTEAKKLALANTQFENSNGLEAQGQYSTAADMAALARHIWVAYPDFKHYTDVQSFTWNKITQQNFNRLIGTDPRVTGLKSGYLSVSGYHLVTTASEGNTDLVGVVMGTQSLNSSADESEKLLNWGFGNYHDVSVDWSSGLPKAAPVWKGRTATLPLRISGNQWVTVSGGAAAPKGSGPSVVVQLYRPLVAPLRAGQVVGTAKVVLGGDTLATASVNAAVAVPRGNFVHVLWDSFRLRFAAWWMHLRR